MTLLHPTKCPILDTRLDRLYSSVQKVLSPFLPDESMHCTAVKATQSTGQTKGVKYRECILCNGVAATADWLTEGARRSLSTLMSDLFLVTPSQDLPPLCSLNYHVPLSPDNTLRASVLAFSSPKKNCTNASHSHFHALANSPSLIQPLPPPPHNLPEARNMLLHSHPSLSRILDIHK